MYAIPNISNLLIFKVKKKNMTQTSRDLPKVNSEFVSEPELGLRTYDLLSNTDALICQRTVAS